MDLAGKIKVGIHFLWRKSYFDFVWNPLQVQIGRLFSALSAAF